MGGLGDCVLFSPVLRALRARYPNAMVELLAASDLVEGLYSGCREVDRVSVIRTAELGSVGRVAALWRYARRARSDGGFDVGVFATGLSPAWPVLLKSAAGIGLVARADVAAGEATDLACNTELAARFWGPARKTGAFVPVAEEGLREADAALRVGGHGPEHGGFMAVYVSVESARRRCWPVELLVEVAGSMKASFPGLRVVVIGAAEEGAAWRAADKDSVADINLAGGLSIAGTAGLLSRSRLLLGNDGGPMHMGGAIGIRVVDIAPNVSVGYTPPGCRTVVMRSGDRECARPDCGIPTADVEAACRKLLNEE